jgi:hypothetical protein
MQIRIALLFFVWCCVSSIIGKELTLNDIPLLEDVSIDTIIRVSVITVSDKKVNFVNFRMTKKGVEKKW